VSCFLTVNAQDTYLGWKGDELIPESDFFNADKWDCYFSEGSSGYITDSDTSLDIHWNLASGSGHWVIAVYTFADPISLSGKDIFGFDIHGSDNNAGNPCHTNQVIEIKLEDGSHQAVHQRMGEDGILGVDRWVENMFSKTRDNFFTIPQDFSWDHVEKVSFGIVSHPWRQDNPADSGVLSIRNFRAGTMSEWPVAASFEMLDTGQDTLNILKENALGFILSRQKTTGLLTTWEEDGSSWLYGQGLALKILSLEGEWTFPTGIPQNEPAIAARNLARFLASQIQAEGYWPRAWDSYSGDVRVMYEDKGSIWMGDFPWILTGLYSYFKRSGDCAVIPAIETGLDFLRSLIDEDGTFHTYNAITGSTEPVTSSEAYAAAINALLELGENELANLMADRIDLDTWDDQLHYWKEGVYSDRVVLFTNTWLAAILKERGFHDQALQALSLAGHLLYTCGPGEPCGLDGIGPVAVWYEGVLSYISARGPGSNELFDNILLFINQNGSVPHYNDDIGGTAGIWAESWQSLDGTSWLYYVTAGISPFDTVPTVYNNSCISGLRDLYKDRADMIIYPNPCSNTLTIQSLSRRTAEYQFYTNTGHMVCEGELSGNKYLCMIDLTAFPPGIYTVVISSYENLVIRKIAVIRK
jgi:hypothetical protein